MNFFSKEWLYIGAAAAIAVLAVYRLASLKRRKLLSQFASARLLPQLAGNFSEAKFFLKRALFLAGVIFVFIAMARPQWGYRWEETKTRGIDIIFAIDTSKSMLAEDVTPNRLERAKLAVMDLVNALKGDKIGIVAFSGQAFLQCPLTLDYDAFRLSLDALDTDIIKRGGTNIAAAIAESEVAFADTSNKKTIVLISDGEELEASALAKAEECAKRDVTIYTLGVGGVKGKQIPIRDARGRLTYVKDEFGNAVTSKLNEEVLEKIAKTTGGFYEPLSANGMDLIYEEGLKKIPQHEMSARMKQLAIERFQIPLLIAIILLALEPLIGTRKFFVRARFGGKAALLAVAAALSAGFPEDARADEGDGGGDAPERRAFNEGVDAYEKRDFAGAKEKFTEAIRLDEELKIHPKSFYNMAASDYRAARDAFAKARPASEFKNLDRRILAQTVQTSQNSAVLLREGLELLKREQAAAKQAEGKGDEAVKAAAQNSPLRDKQFQERLKQGISQCEAAEKSADEAQKSISENIGTIAAAAASLDSSIKSLNSALAIDPEYAKAKKNLATAKSAQKNLNSETDILQNALSAFTDQNGDVRAAVENLKKIKEELKKLLRDDQNQNQQNQNQQNQQNQDQQNQNQQNQNQQNQQNQNQQNQQNQDQNQQQSQSQQNQDQQQQNQNKDQQQNQQDKQNQQGQQGQDQQQQQNQQDKDKDGQKTDSEKSEDNQKQDASKGSDSREQKPGSDSRQNDNSDQNKDEQAIDSGAPREEKNADNPKDNQAQQGEESGERRDEQAAPADNRQLRQVEAGTEAKDDKAGENYRKAAGAMSRAEARQLLDALKADEKSLPHSGFGEQRRRYEEKTYKDW